MRNAKLSAANNNKSFQVMNSMDVLLVCYLTGINDVSAHQKREVNCDQQA
jgi:hypothetical protein